MCVRWADTTHEHAKSRPDQVPFSIVLITTVTSTTTSQGIRNKLCCRFKETRGRDCNLRQFA